MFSWAVAFVYLLFQYKFNIKILGIYTAPLLLIITIAAYITHGETFEQKNISNFWLHSHIISMFIGEGSMALACGIGIFYLLHETQIKTKKKGFFFKRLPSLEILDTGGYFSIVLGFLMITLGLVTGFIYSNLLWGKFFINDPKIVWSGITWIVYAIILHERLAVGWRGRKTAVLAIIGFIIVLFTFLGVNLFFGGHHGEFTKW
ncbi:MAG: cytochrome c biogenesis protein CcsA [Desulfobacterales bacterium]|nr:cytochrome c biogenesis protein CcsA [Desulfobacterales bacterium]